MGYFDRLNQLMNMRVKLDNRDTKEIQQIYRDTVTQPKIKMFKILFLQDILSQEI